MRRLVPILLLGALLPAAPASAAAITIVTRDVPSSDRYGDYTYVETTILFVAAPGERNDVTETRERSAVRFRDAGASIDAPPPCRQEAGGEVVCPFAGAVLVGVDAGDQPDTVRSDGGEVQGGSGDDRLEGSGNLDGGEGDDLLLGAHAVGGPGADVLDASALTVASASLDGGPGDDVVRNGAGGGLLRGGSGRDEVHGGAGEETLVDGDGIDGRPVDADLLVGNGGRDLVAYERATPVTIDLNAPDSAGARGERDRLVGIEGAIGGSGDDLLRGDAGANRLFGEAGRDTLVGGAADDRLDGGLGDDVVAGEAGGDEIVEARFGSGHDTLSGGDGDDRITGGDGHDRISGGMGDDGISAGEGVDSVFAGDGDDEVGVSHDFRDDRVHCGGGADALGADVGERRPIACERVVRAPLGRLLQGHAFRQRERERVLVRRRDRGRVVAWVDCVDQLLMDCMGRARIVARVGGRRRVVARGRWGRRGGPTASGGVVRMRGLRLDRVAWRALRRTGRLRATFELEVAPGRGRGGLVARDPALLRLA